MNRIGLPPDWRLRPVTKALAETIDWGATWLGLPDLWLQTQGAGVRVAVLDTGCDLNHPDLQGAIVGQHDFSRSRLGVSDVQGHGTWCAGYIGARANGIGVRGIAPQCELLIGKVLGDDGTGNDRDILAGIVWAAKNGADVISLSLGGPMMGADVRSAIREFVRTPGKYLFAAAGNDGHSAGIDTVGYPARWPETISVAAVDKSGNLTSFSSFNDAVTIAAPGFEMISTIPVIRGGRGGYGAMSGTSMATPCAAGIGALAIAKHKSVAGDTPLDTVAAMQDHLRKTAKIINGVRVIAPGALLDRKPTGPSVPQKLPIGTLSAFLVSLGYEVQRDGDKLSVAA